MLDPLWLLPFFVPVLGHVLYGIPGSGRVRLHNGDDFSPADEPPRPDRLCNIRAVTADTVTPLDAPAGAEIDATAITARPACILVETPPLTIELAPEKFHSYLRHEGLLAVIAQREVAGQSSEPGRERYSKFSKTALAGPDGSLSLLTRPLGLPAEIVPLTAETLHTNSTLRIRVDSHGAPLPHTQVRISHRHFHAAEPSPDLLLETDASGELEFPLSRPGYWRLHTIRMVAATGPGANWESWWASLTFALQS